MALIHRHPAVAVDLIESAEYLSKESLDTALRFLDAVESTFAFIAKNPEIGTLCKFRTTAAERVRFWPIKGFEKYLMFYEAVHDGIDVMRVIHGARDLETILTE